MDEQVGRYVLIAHQGEPVSGDNIRYLALTGEKQVQYGACFSFEVVPYHWNDRKKFARDCDVVQELYERYLSALVPKLNKFHQTHYSERYWRIIVGPWLYPTIALLFDRWEMVDKAFSEYAIDCAEVVDHDLKELVEIDFRSINPFEARYNEAIYTTILRCRGGIELCEKERTASLPRPVKPARASVSKRVLVAFNRWMGRWAQPDYFFHGSYLSPRIESMLNLKFKQFPRRFVSPDYPFQELSLSDRSGLRVREFDKGVEKAINEIIPEIMPMIYVEGYQQITASLSSYGWPQNPKVIFTSVSYNADEIFKIWAASKVEQGSKLVIGQHGGSLGLARCTRVEKHYAKSADRFITWGWLNGFSNTYAGPAFKLIGRGGSVSDKNGGLLLLPTIFSGLSYKMVSDPVGYDQSMEYLQQQKQFVELLDSVIRCRTMVRLRGELEKRLGVCYSETFEHQFDDVCVDYSKEGIGKRLKESRLLVVSYNGTAFLETLSDNYPTVIMFDPGKSELREDGVAMMAVLEKVGIFHSSAQSAAAHVNKVWESVDLWWNDEKTQTARWEFCKRYVRLEENPLLEMKEALMVP